MRISIVQFERSGVPDTDVSICVPENGEKCNSLSAKDIKEILDSEVEECIFYEKDRGTVPMKNFPALKMSNWYFLWLEEVTSWIAIYFSTEPSPEGFTSPVEIDFTITAGPYNIGTEGSKLIKEYFKSNIPLEDITKTSIIKLKEAQN